MAEENEVKEPVKCEKEIPQDVLLGIGNFLDLIPCKIPEVDEKKKKKVEELSADVVTV